MSYAAGVRLDSLCRDLPLTTGLYAAIAMTLRLLLSPFRSYDRHRSWRRIVSDESFRFISSRLRVNQMQYIMVSTISVYLEWVQKYSEKTLLDYLDEDGNLMWFTERDTTGKVVFYVHGKFETRTPK